VAADQRACGRPWRRLGGYAALGHCIFFVASPDLPPGRRAVCAAAVATIGVPVLRQPGAAVVVQTLFLDVLESALTRSGPAVHDRVRRRGCAHAAKIPPGRRRRAPCKAPTWTSRSWPTCGSWPLRPHRLCMGTAGKKNRRPHTGTGM
jgi:hypothetical protein